VREAPDWCPVVPDEMRAAQARLQELSDKTLGQALELLGDEW